MSQVNAHAAGTPARTSRQRWYALAVCMAGGFIVFLDVSIVNVALPTISRQLRASGSLLQWIVAGYSLAFGLVLVPAGRLGDIMGHRMLFTTGLGAFVAASAVCGAAPTAAVLAGQRIGASIGVAAAGSAFFATLRGGGSFCGRLPQRHHRHVGHRRRSAGARADRPPPRDSSSSPTEVCLTRLVSDLDPPLWHPRGMRASCVTPMPLRCLPLSIASSPTSEIPRRSPCYACPACAKACAGKHCNQADIARRPRPAIVT